MYTVCASLMILVWFFVCGLSSQSRFFHSYGDVTIVCEGPQILTYARHSWPLTSEGYLAFHTCCDTGHPFIMVIPEGASVYNGHLRGPLTLTPIAGHLAVELSLPVLPLGHVASEIRTLNILLPGPTHCV